MTLAFLTHCVTHSTFGKLVMTNLISYSGESSIIIVHVKWRINGHRRSEHNMEMIGGVGNGG